MKVRDCAHDPACVWPWHSYRCAILRMQFQRDEALNALADVVVKATPDGEDSDGFIVGYRSSTGAIHRAIPLLDRHGITVRPGGFDGRLSSRAGDA